MDMAGSVLLKLARDSILEVFQAKRLIEKRRLLEAYPVLATAMACRVAIYLDERLLGSFKSEAEDPLVENIILAAKKAAFESGHVLTSSEYLHVQVALTLYTPDGEISEKDMPLLSDKETLFLSD